MSSNYKQTRLERGKQLRQSLEDSVNQDFAALDKNKLRKEDFQNQEKNIEKNLVIPSYSREM